MEEIKSLLFLIQNFPRALSLLEENNKISREQNEEAFLNEYMLEERVQKQLNISRKQLYNLRMARKIGYYKMGKKVYISRRSLKEYFESNYIKSINY